MDYIYSFIDWISLQMSFITDFFKAIPQMTLDLFSYIQIFMIKMKLKAELEFIKLSYNSAQILLKEIGFNDILSKAFNALPDELRFYAFKFGVPQGLAVWANFFTTALVMRLSR
ncbi:DUF2523 domain-containing protein [Vibrio sp. 10N.286.55.E10]|jgi:hypothetical protein|uniref:DUF2523 domain-containing protein n=1 Tax=Vibrio crassostreae TaxID=246167 RepID=A0A822N480_9VIBR|nr:MULTISPECIES: hypothetical protein [Vibrio]CAH6804376.1 conserved hypothetical protein [Vibrio chagasii]MBU2908789.1 DUF2523 domain-containing protein [Vibrio splendidus]MDH5953225.1 DUF2523 domain-containing protein [Vibrio crassostreae]MDO6530734.1 DUF2523 domain-containing protein [Vibrio splendidus]MDO6552194.1 DUF2523 domain-containing protein [Vibrio splendidus]